MPLARADNSDDGQARIRLSYDLESLLAEDPLALPGGRSAALAQAAPPFAMASGDPRQIEAATECLAAAAYHEARSEGEEGQRAVVQVVLNRVRHYAFPSTICGVVYQRTSGGVCQFSFTCDGSMRRRIEPQAWAAARRLARDALDGFVYQPVGLATRFHASYVRPRWSMTLPRVTRVGAHSFYLERGPAGRSGAFVRSSASLERATPPAS